MQRSHNCRAVLLFSPNIVAAHVLFSTVIPKIMSGTGPVASQQETRRSPATAKSQSLTATSHGNKDGGSLTEQASLVQVVTDNLHALLDEKFAHFESTFDSIATRLEDNTKPITEAENSVSQTEDKVVEFHNKIVVLEKNMQSLTERAVDTENRCQRDNIHIVGLKEGSSTC